ncbi:hypothetical protein HD806DRAFT_517004 [Xylariaceae sp. AK1471]|nr:hypothetical protein HD806DRAFT_517004 [Xylariaceae sp. AK1471]
MTTLISTRVVQCLRLFRDVLDFPSGENDDLYQPLLEEFARLKLWTGNIGAHQSGRGSLDYRLRDASHLRDLVLGLLSDLENVLQEVPSIPDNDINPTLGLGEIRHDNPDEAYRPSNDDSDDISELAEVIADIKDIIACLLRLSMSIRNPAPHDHFMSSNFTDTSHFEEFDISHVKSKFPGLDISLADRIGKAISHRRQYFKYREHHHQKLSWALDVDTDMCDHDHQSTVASSIPKGMKTETAGQPAFARLNEDERSDTGVTATSFATSMTNSGRLKVPPLPKQADDGPFECPYCFMIISVSTRIGWKKHVCADLRPYICLALNCLTPEKQYAHRHEWIDHMNQKHWSIFICPYSCQEQEFSTPSHLRRHLQESHSALSLESNLGTMVQLCERPKSWTQDTQCPFCSQNIYSMKVYARHVGQHQTELALFALPNIGDDEEKPKDIETHQEDGDDSLNQSDSEVESIPSYTEMEMSDVADDELNPRSVSVEPSLTSDHLSATTLGFSKSAIIPESGSQTEQLICPECGRKFDQIHKLNHHKRYHDRTHECTYVGCDMKFGTKTHLDRHIYDRHLPIKTFHCTEPTCVWFKGGKSFPRKDNLRRHMMKKHGMSEDELLQLDSVIQTQGVSKD